MQMPCFFQTVRSFRRGVFKSVLHDQTAEIDDPRKNLSESLARFATPGKHLHWPSHFLLSAWYGVAQECT